MGLEAPRNAKFIQDSWEWVSMVPAKSVLNETRRGKPRECIPSSDFVVAIHSLFSEDLTRPGAPLRITRGSLVWGRCAAGDTQTIRFK